jgi:hypothetical protein
MRAFATHGPALVSLHLQRVLHDDFIETDRPMARHALAR